MKSTLFFQLKNIVKAHKYRSKSQINYIHIYIYIPLSDYKLFTTCSQEEVLAKLASSLDDESGLSQFLLPWDDDVHGRRIWLLQVHTPFSILLQKPLPC
mmetsp:Transcript_14978/g.18537  ORF Transcript_14978/g.18537 Transcript_14978/m.18537 type:complete len:99 (+) Transcript_14978:75-371(+)